VNARGKAYGFIGAVFGFVASLVLFQYVLLGGLVQPILLLAGLTFLGYANPPEVCVVRECTGLVPDP